MDIPEPVLAKEVGNVDRHAIFRKEVWLTAGLFAIGCVINRLRIGTELLLRLPVTVAMILSLFMSAGQTLAEGQNTPTEAEVEQIRRQWQQWRQEIKNKPLNREEQTCEAPLATNAFSTACTKICMATPPDWWLKRADYILHSKSGHTPKALRDFLKSLSPLHDYWDSGLYKNDDLRDDLWIAQGSLTDAVPSENPSFDPLRLIPKHPQLQDRMQELERRQFGIAIAAYSSKSKIVLALHNPIRISDYEIICIDKETGNQLWHKRIISPFQGPWAWGGSSDIVHCVQIVQSPRGLILYGADLGEIYLAILDPNSGAGDILFSNSSPPRPNTSR